MSDQTNGQDPFLADASETSSSGYSPDKFYTASRDRKGFKTTMRVNVPPTLLSEVAALVASGNVPEFRTSQDVIRNALVHGLHVIAQTQKDPPISRASEAFRQWAELEHASEYIRMLNQTVDEAKKTVQSARGRRQRQTAIEIVEKIRDNTTDDYVKTQMELLIQEHG